MLEPELPQQPDESTEPALTPDQIAASKRRVRGPGPFYYGDQVLERLQALEKEWEHTGGFDREYAKAFRARLDEEYPPHYVVNGRTA